MQMLYRYGSSLWNMKSFVRKMMYKFSRIYDVQKNGLSFEDPVRMLKAMGTVYIFGVKSVMHSRAIRVYARNAGSGVEEEWNG